MTLRINFKLANTITATVYVVIHLDYFSNEGRSGCIYLSIFLLLFFFAQLSVLQGSFLLYDKYSQIAYQ